MAGAAPSMWWMRPAGAGGLPPAGLPQGLGRAEKFLGETAGMWQYAVDVATEAMLVEDADVNTEPPDRCHLRGETMKYRYSGPTSGVTLQKGEEAQEVMLHTGTEVELPEEHEVHQDPAGSGSPDPGRPATKTSARTSAGTDEPAAKGA
jgi:hypothetical protein